MLQKYTRDKIVKGLGIDLQQKQMVELAKEATWQLEKSRSPSWSGRSLHAP